MHRIVQVPDSDRLLFDRLALHPMQSWEWGEFRIKTGIKVLRLGRYEDNTLVETAQITIHPLPFTTAAIGYFPKGGIPSSQMMEALVSFGKREHCLFIKLEPNIINGTEGEQWKHAVRRSPHPLFTRYTFHLDITPSEEALLKGMHHKTRYNIRVAQKHGVRVAEDNSEEAVNDYIRLTFETTKRQKFFAHTERYHRLMWETLHPPGIARLLRATYTHEGTTHTLAAWVLFLFNNVLYYPYGASSDQFRSVMASNLIMWEAIRFGKAQGATQFDLWGAMGTNPDPTDPWYGFHRFKQGYGAQLVELLGSYDLVMNPTSYRFYNLAHHGRQLLLRLRALI